MENAKPDLNLESHDDWLPCQRGIIPAPQMRLSERFAKRKADVFSLSLIYFSGVLVAMTVFTSWKNSLDPASSYTYDHISCNEVRHHLCSYANLEISSCRLRASISKHLCSCPNCDRAYQEMIGNHLASSPTLTECSVVEPTVTALKR
jgi:hypothetical protein